MKPANFALIFFAVLILQFPADAVLAENQPRMDAFWAINSAESLPQLRVEFQEYLTNYPGSKYEAQAARTVEILTRMIAEEKSHGAPSNLARLPIADRVREFIFQLRYENTIDSPMNFPNDIFRDPPGASSPAHQLADTGYAAVPQLIAALGDQTLTRSLRQTSTFSYATMSVDDWAIAILQRIAGKSFFPPFVIDGYWLPQEKRVSMAHEAIKTWWTEFQKKGEKEMLLEGTESGDGDAPNQAEYLIEHYPTIALASLIKGTRAATDQRARTALVQLFEKFDSPDATAFLEEELHGGDRDSNVAAAHVLKRANKPEAVTAMIHAWENSMNTDHDESLIDFLVRANSPEAIAALERNLPDRHEDSRMEVIDGIDHVRWGGAAWEKNFSKATTTAMEKLLVTSLQDEGQKWGLSGSLIDEHHLNRDVIISNPRICDMAGFLLNQCWPQRYEFDLSASFKIRDQQRIECQNVWRSGHDLPLPPVPPPPTNQVVPNENTKVTAIAWQTGTVQPSSAFAACVAAFENRFLTATNIVRLLTSYAANPDAGTGGLILKMRKDEDLTGVKLSISLLPGTPPKSTGIWEFAYGGTSGGVLATETESWNGLAREINQAVAEPPETPFMIGVKLVAGP